MSKQQTVCEPVQVEVTPVSDVTRHTISSESDRASRGLTQMFGLDPRAAMLVMLVDVMLFGGEMATLGAFLVVSVLVAAILGLIVYKIQRAWFGDDQESSLIKGLIVGLLTAIPAPLTPLLAVPCGIAGAIQWVRRR